MNLRFAMYHTGHSIENIDKLIPAVIDLTASSTDDEEQTPKKKK
jgi:hypothetical protein